jgi:hypothetical protein
MVVRTIPTLNQMEMPMLYKTITLQLLQQQHQLYDQLCRERKLLPTLDLYATQLRNHYLALKETLARLYPGSEESRIASQAREIALQELEDRLSSGSAPLDSGPLSLDQAMAYLRRHSLSA